MPLQRMGQQILKLFGRNAEPQPKPQDEPQP
jgi:hypothetical protein